MRDAATIVRGESGQSPNPINDPNAASKQKRTAILRDRTNEIVNERYRFTNIRNSAMRIVGALGVALAGLSVISVGVVTAYGFDMRSQYGGTTTGSTLTDIRS